MKLDPRFELYIMTQSCRFDFEVRFLAESGPTPKSATMTQSFEIVFNVEMSCGSCEESIRKSLSHLELDEVTIDRTKQTVTVIGTQPPSTVVDAIRSTGKDAIIRGTGRPNSAAVCILESFAPQDSDLPVKGLARIVGVSDHRLFFDLTLNGMPKGKYYPQIRSSGNLSLGALSTGSLFYSFKPIVVDQATPKKHGFLAELFSAQTFLSADLSVTDLIGRSIVLSTIENEVTKDSICGVIARSAGAWENSKEICSCTGKSVWQERVDALRRGITS